MTQAETIYSARQLSEELGITLQMLSVYAKCYTQLTKTQISKQGRLGRHFTEAQRQVIRNAREMVQNNTGMTVDEAMRKALVFDAGSLETPVQLEGAAVDLEALRTVLSESLRDEIATPLIAEIRLLRAEVAELKGRELPTIHNPARENKNPQVVEATAEDRQHSLLVRAVLWLEQKLRSK